MSLSSRALPLLRQSLAMSGISSSVPLVGGMSYASFEAVFKTNALKVATVSTLRGFASASPPPSDAKMKKKDDYSADEKTRPASSMMMGNVQKTGAMLRSEYCQTMTHPVYTKDYLEDVKPIDPAMAAPRNMHERIGLALVTALRTVYDRSTGYQPDKPMSANTWLKRFVVLESVAAVPGLVAGSLRHLRSLRLMQPDMGWINTLISEAENERHHLLTFLHYHRPSMLTRAIVLAAQGIVWNIYFACYLLSPKTCHAFVHMLEREAVRTYTHAIHDLRSGHLKEWEQLPAPELARNYWKLHDAAKMEDVLLVIRADEKAHWKVNELYSTIDADDKSPVSQHTHIFK